MKSILESKFFEYVEQKNIQLISFDIFETLVFRKVASPKDIFYLVGQNEYVKGIFTSQNAFKQYRINAEKEARRKNNHKEDITLDEIYNQLPLSQDEKTKIIDIELKIESENLFINRQIEDWMIQAYKKGITIILVSDMYLSYKHISKLVLEKLKSINIIDKVYISCEYGKTKAKGSMYKLIHEERKVSLENWLHIGDNHRVDIKNAEQYGIKALYYNVENYIREMFKLEDMYIQNNFNSIRNLRVLSALQNPYIESDKRFFYNYGATILGPILFEFCYWVKDIVEKYKLSQVNFIMREGRIFEKYFKKLFPDIETNLIFASRKSTYLAVQDPDKFEIDKLELYTYRDFTIEDFYLLYHLEIDDVSIEKYKNIQYKDSNTIYINDKSLWELFSEDILSKQAIIKNNIIQQKEYLKAYFKELGIKKDSIFIDFGGTGTILTRFEEVFEINSIKNGLLYMHEKGYEKQVSRNTLSFFPYTNGTQYALALLHRSPEFMEFLLNGMEKTTLSYIKKKNNKIKPVIEYPYENIVENKDCFEAFDTGVKSYFRCSEFSDFSNVNKEFLTLILARSIDVPLEEEVKYFGKIYHDEGGGSSSRKQLISDYSKDIILKIGMEKVYKNFQKNIRYKRNEVHWLQGVLSSIDKSYIKDMKGLSSTNVNQNTIDYFLEILDENTEIKKLNIYGAGEFFDQIKGCLEIRDIEIISIIDSRAEQGSFFYDDYLVLPLEKVINENNSFPVIITSVAFSEEITNKIIQYIKSKNLNISLINALNGFVTVS